MSISLMRCKAPGRSSFQFFEINVGVVVVVVAALVLGALAHGQTLITMLKLLFELRDISHWQPSAYTTACSKGQGL